MLVLSLGLVACGLLLQFWGTSSNIELGRGISLKVGIVLFMMWLAYPQLRRLNPWLVVPVGTAALVAILRPQLLLVVPRIAIPLAPILFVTWLLWVPNKRAARHRDGKGP